LYAKGSPFHDRLVLTLPTYKNVFGISTYVPGKGVHAVTVLSRTACWAAAFAQDIANRLLAGEAVGSVLNRAQSYVDVGGIVVISGRTIVVGGDLAIKPVNGDS
ncbi:MAG: hypothetical protein FJY85_21265, partial [Deltaproteobacteria bacterium]|nr:hypothetical protein [Deltaproteobacteria bacterium]